MIQLTQKRQQFFEVQKMKLSKAIVHLEYSYHKICLLSERIDFSNEEDLETWESFASRFNRVADLFLMKYLKTRLLLEDPGFSGSLRDALYFGEKLKFIQDPDAWLAVRELRNIAAHEYAEEDLTLFFKRLKHEAPRLIALKGQL